MKGIKLIGLLFGALLLASFAKATISISTGSTAGVKWSDNETANIWVKACFVANANNDGQKIWFKLLDDTTEKFHIAVGSNTPSLDINFTDLFDEKMIFTSSFTVKSNVASTSSKIMCSWEYMRIP